MFRFIDEIFNPYLKCARLHHKYVNKKVMTLKKSNFNNLIYDNFYAVIPTCKRCNAKLPPTNFKFNTYWSSFKISKKIWKSIKKDGFIIID